MENKFNFSDKLDFNDIDMTAPEKVIADILIQLSKETGFINLPFIYAFTPLIKS